jgi:hypothetical protein
MVGPPRIFCSLIAMEKLPIVSMVASYIATLFVHLLVITQLCRVAREHFLLWALSGKFEFSVGFVVIGFEIRSDFLQSHKQNVLGLDIDQVLSNSANTVFECLVKMM